jgi:ArsR family transcriptional regulator, arsenate/arsenite/antimonite-responsive transcriptional repressor
MVREEHAEALKALSHLSRLAIFFHLVRARGEVTAGEIQDGLGLAGPTLSHHLEILRRAGLIARRRDGRFIHYAVRRDKVSELVRLLTACC